MEDQVLVRASSLEDLPKDKKPPADDLSSGADEAASCRNEVIAKVGSKRAYHETEDRKAKQAQDNWLESARAEMGEVREENQRLKKHLSHMMKEYQALQMKFHVIVQQEETKKSTLTVDNHDHQKDEEEPELVSLSLGRFSGDQTKKDGKSKTASQGLHDDEMANEGLSLGLDCKFEGSKSLGNEQPSQNLSPVDSSCEGQAKEEAGETWPPRVVKSGATTMASGEDEAAQQNSVKKARVCVRARCDTPTMNDGCQWRKYGQKIAKGNPCPRAYYRCTVAQSCPVRKQVQRCAEDMSILITTYEGTHNHPLPLSATAMASTTSAAASMLLSGSSSSSQTGGPKSSSATIPSDLHGLNFYLSNNSSGPNKQLYFHNSSFSPSPSHPTITLDLTSSSSSFNRLFPSSYPPIPKFAPSNTLNFSSSESTTVPWNNNGFFSYGKTTSQPFNKNPLIGNLNLGRPSSTIENNIFQSYIQTKTPISSSTTTTPTSQPLPDTLAAATKAITADPNFQSVLAAALSSIIGTGTASNGGVNHSGGDNLAQKLKWGEHFPVASTYSTTSSTPKGNACATSYMNKPTSTTNSQTGSLMFLTSDHSLPFSSSKSASASPSDNRDHAR